MAIKKYINTKDVVELTGCTTSEIVNLAKTGVLPSHKTRRGWWRFHVDAVEKYFGIQINKPIEKIDRSAPKVVRRHEENAAKPAPEGKLVKSFGTYLVTNNEHYREVIDRICAAESSVKIMTANFKRFKLKPKGYQGKDYKDGTPFIKYLMAKAVQGVSVQIICSRPSSSFSDEWQEYYQQMNPELFEYMFCERNHAKVVIIDERIAYIGSANVTPAGLGQGLFTPGNFEAGILTMEPGVVSSAKTLFSEIWEKAACHKCHRADVCNEII